MASLVTAYAVRNMVFANKKLAKTMNLMLYKGEERITAILAVAHEDRIFPTNPLIMISEKQNGNA